MNPKLKNIFKIFSRFRMGFQDLRVSPGVASAVLLLSLVQTVGGYLHFLDPDSGMLPFQKLFALTDFVFFFDYIYRQDPVLPILAVEVVFLGAFGVFWGSVLASHDAEDSTERVEAEDFLPGNAFTQPFGILFVPWLLHPLVSLAVALFSCGSVTPESQFRPVVRTVAAICNSPHSTLRVLGQVVAIFNVICGLFLAGCQILFFTPRNPVAENALFTQSRIFDGITALLTGLSGLAILSSLYPSLILRAFALCTLLLLQAIQLRGAFTRITYTYIRSVTSSRFCIVFSLLFLIYELVYIVSTSMTDALQLLSPLHDAAIFTTVSILSFNLIHHTIVHSTIASLRTHQLQPHNLKSLYLLLAYTRETPTTDSRRQAELQEIYAHLFQHFMDCISSHCLCGTLKSGEKIWDPESNSFFGLPDLSNADEVGRLVSTPFFARILVRYRLEHSLATRECPFYLKLFFLQFSMFELQDSSLSSRLLQQLQNHPSNFLDQFDLDQLGRVFQAGFIFTTQIQSARKNCMKVEALVWAEENMRKRENLLCEVLSLLVEFYELLATETVDPFSKSKTVARLLLTVSPRMKSLRALFKEPIPNQHALLLAIAFYRTLCLDEARAIHLTAQLTKINQKLFELSR